MKLHPRLLIVTLLLAVAFNGCSAEAKKERRLDRAEKNFKAGDYDKAKIDYFGALQLDPKNATAIQRLGLIWSEQGAPLRALPFLLKTRELNPDDFEARKKLAVALASIGQMDEARKEAIAILRHDPKDGDALLRLFETVRTPEQVAEAEEELNKFPAKDSAEFHIAAATMALRKNDRAAAERELAEALKTGSTMAVVHTAAGTMALLTNDRTKAGEEFKKAAELSPLRSSARIKHAEFLLATGAGDAAQAALTEITAKAPDYVPAWRLLSQIALSKKDYKGAATLLENVFSRDPQDLDARAIEANIFVAQGEPKKALEVLERVDTSYEGKVPGIKLQLAKAAVMAGNPNQAQTALQQALAMNPEYPEAILALAELNLRSGQTAPAMTALQELLNKRPDLPQTRVLLAAGLQASNQLDEAATLLREQIRSFPGDLRSSALLANILQRQKKSAEAHEVLEKAVQTAPADIGLFAKLVDLDLEEKNFDAAMQRVRGLLEKQPKSAPTQFLEAKVLFTKGDYAGAEAALQKTLALDPNLPETYDLLVRTYLATDKLSEAARQLDGVLTKNPEDTRAAMTLGLVREKMKDFPSAAVAYEKVLARSPDSVPALNNLAYLYAEHLNEPQKAVELARKARNEQPGDASVADTLGWALFKQRDYPQALVFLQEAGEMLGTNPDVQFHLGMAHYMMGQPEAAKSAFEQALKAPADFAGKEEAQRRLALLAGGAGTAGLSREALEKSVAEQPGDIVGWMRLAEVYEAEQNLPKAAEAYEKARQLNPNLLPVNLKLAQFNAGFLNKSEKALEFAKRARELAPNDPGVAGTLGSIVLRAGNAAWAHSLLLEAARGKDDPILLYDLGLAAYALGKLDEARQTIQRLTSNPASPRAEEAKRFLKLTALEPSSPDLDAAAQEIDAVLQSEPDFVPALMARGAVQSKGGKQDAAIATYTDVLRRFRDFAPAQKRLAAIYVTRTSDLQKADELAGAARRTLSADPELMTISGEIKFKQKDYAAAARLLQQSAALAPLSPAGLYYLGTAQLETKQDAKGRETLEKALAAGLPDLMAQDARQRLAPEKRKN